MSIELELSHRSGSTCELCGTSNDLDVYQVPPKSSDIPDENALLCGTCLSQIQNPDQADPNHWRCLNDSMWSTIPAVQVIAWRMLDRLRSEGWPADLLDMLYLDDETLNWAKSGIQEEVDTSIKHLDGNGSLLKSGDTVVLIKDLNVKGANFTAKRGTAVRGISLVHDNPDHIEGRVNGQQIVILTKFVKKQG